MPEEEKPEIVEQVKKTKRVKKRFSSNVWFILIAIAVGLGYVAGVYHYQIEAFIGPVFGYKAHSGNLDLSSLQEAYNVLAANYDGNLDTTKLIQGAKRGMTAAAGDKYTIYMTPSEATEYNNDLDGNIGGGIGAEIGIKNSKVTITKVLDNNPAKAAGLMTNDIILDINDESTSGMTADTAVGLVRGDEGTTVKLTIQRGTELKDYTITRATINNPSVISSVSDGIGTMTILRFDNDTADLAKIAAQNFKKQGVKAIIVDLRDNGGGYLSAARDVVGLWLNNQVVVTERTSDGTIKDTIKTGKSAILNDIPTVVLVNGNSASASEIVAGALHDHKAAQLVGEKTFGKGSVQQLISLSDGSQLKITIARWYTPNGVNINQEGITPDITASLTQANIDNSVDPQMDAAKKALGL